MSRIELTEMRTPEDVEAARQLVLGYVRWLFESFPEEHDDVSAVYGDDTVRKTLDEIPVAFLRPHGLGLIGRLGGLPCGCVFVQPVGDGIVEIKRLFVLPAARGHGLGRKLVETIIAKASELGHTTIRLDTAIFLKDAIALYRSLGFEEIEPYYEMPEAAQANAIFMQRRL